MSVEIGTVCFSHGKESGPWGSKIKRLAKVAERCGFAVESIDYRGLVDPDERVAKLLAWRPAVGGRLVFVGSSMGSYVAAAIVAMNEVKGLKYEIIPMGTVMEADSLEIIFEAVKVAHEAYLVRAYSELSRLG